MTAYTGSVATEFDAVIFYLREDGARLNEIQLELVSAATPTP